MIGDYSYGQNPYKVGGLLSFLKTQQLGSYKYPQSIPFRAKPKSGNQNPPEIVVDDDYIKRQREGDLKKRAREEYFTLAPSGPERAGAGRPEVPFGTESRGIPSMPLSQAQIEANNRYAYAKRLENELGISRAQSQLAMQPLLAGVQRGILGKIGSRFGINPSAYPMPQYPQQTAFGGQGFNWQNIGYAPPFPQRMVG